METFWAHEHSTRANFHQDGLNKSNNSRQWFGGGGNYRLRNLLTTQGVCGEIIMTLVMEYLRNMFGIFVLNGNNLESSGTAQHQHKSTVLFK